ncbi:MAG: hypothetical protein CFK52_14640, partial [Chloracidobacterium sp. CP2_5A]
EPDWPTGDTPYAKAVVKSARRRWRELAALFAERGDTEADTAGLLELLCVCYGRWRAAEDMIAAEGPVTRAGEVSKWLLISEKAARLVATLEGELMVSPRKRGGKRKPPKTPTAGPVGIA